MPVIIDLGNMTKHRITAASTDVMFPTLLPFVGSGTDPDVQVDMSKVTFMTPSGATWLWACLRHLKSSGAKIVVLPPEQRPLIYWLRWMQFFHHLEADQIECTLPDMAPIPAGAVSDALLPMTPVRQGEDVIAIVAQSLDRIGSILEQHLGYGKSDIGKFATVLSETCMNILDHSGDIGMIAVQKYCVQHGRPFVMIGIADCGRGVRASLSRAHLEADDWDHETALRQALKHGISGVPNEDRGLGLYFVAKHIREYQGTLHFRSGDTRLRIKEDENVVQTVEMAGTQLCITLSTRRAP
jgi:anti-sigma regulatory factor (Ser/Thr protein kinase)